MLGIAPAKCSSSSKGLRDQARCSRVSLAVRHVLDGARLRLPADSRYESLVRHDRVSVLIRPSGVLVHRLSPDRGNYHAYHP